MGRYQKPETTEEGIYGSENPGVVCFSVFSVRCPKLRRIKRKNKIWKGKQIRDLQKVVVCIRHLVWKLPEKH